MSVVFLSTHSRFTTLKSSTAAAPHPSAWGRFNWVPYVWCFWHDQKKGQFMIFKSFVFRKKNDIEIIKICVLTWMRKDCNYSLSVLRNNHVAGFYNFVKFLWFSSTSLYPSFQVLSHSPGFQCQLIFDFGKQPSPSNGLSFWDTIPSMWLFFKQWHKNNRHEKGQLNDLFKRGQNGRKLKQEARNNN